MRIRDEIERRYRNRIISSPANQRLISEGRLSQNGVDNLARMSAREDDRMRKVNEISNRYMRNIDNASVVNYNQQVSRRTYMGLSNG